MLWPRQELEQRLGRFGSAYNAHYRSRLMRRLGFDAALPEPGALDWLASDALPDLLLPTLQLLVDWPVAFGSFLACLERHVALAGLPAEAEALVPFVPGAPDPPLAAWLAWRDAWWAWSRTWPQPETIAPPPWPAGTCRLPRCALRSSGSGRHVISAMTGACWRIGWSRPGVP